jgi:hypothetical protein
MPSIALSPVQTGLLSIISGIFKISLYLKPLFGIVENKNSREQAAASNCYVVAFILKSAVQTTLCLTIS